MFVLILIALAFLSIKNQFLSFGTVEPKAVVIQKVLIYVNPIELVVI